MKHIKRYALPNEGGSILNNAGSNKGAAVTNLHPLLQRVYANRGVKDMGEVDYSLSNLLPYTSLSDIDLAVACLYQALRVERPILIIGDFDVDGATSTALVVLALRAFGFKRVDYLIPNRFEFGYGLSPEIVAVAAANIATSPPLLITVDNGISSYAGVRAAKELGMQVIITDHHLPQANVDSSSLALASAPVDAQVDASSPELAGVSLLLPPADAIINPNKNGDAFPSKNLAGVGVIFYLMLALRAFLRAQNWFVEGAISEPNMAQFLDLVALGTVADLVPLDYNNRILVHHGLARIRAGKCCLGIKMLLRVANRDYERIKADDLAYAIAPRLNAAGRLDDMAVGVACLLSDSVQHTRLLARELDKLNQERRTIEGGMQQQALQELAKLKLSEREQELPPALCLFDAGWHQGVVGVLASKIKERFNRPTLAFAAVSDDELKGSGRSIEGLHICNVLADIAALHPGLIPKFGGHAMAAGLSLRRADYAKFADIFVAIVRQRMQEVTGIAGAAGAIMEQVIYSDGEMEASYFALETAELLQRSGPWGRSFPEPLFDGIFELVAQRVVGGKHLKITLRVPENKQEVEAIYFNIVEGEWPNHRVAKVHAVYRLDVNEYNGRRSLQLIVENLVPHG